MNPILFYPNFIIILFVLFKEVSFLGGEGLFFNKIRNIVTKEAR